MIGGRDIIIPVARPSEALDLAVRAISTMWPQVVLEDAETGETFQSYAETALAGRREILAFRDPQSAKQWDTLGADPSLDGTLIHFLVGERELTVAIDADPPAQILSFVASLQQNLRREVIGGAR